MRARGVSEGLGRRGVRVGEVEGQEERGGGRCAREARHQREEKAHTAQQGEACEPEGHGGRRNGSNGLKRSKIPWRVGIHFYRILASRIYGCEL